MCALCVNYKLPNAIKHFCHSYKILHYDLLEFAIIYRQHNQIQMN